MKKEESQEYQRGNCSDGREEGDVCGRDCVKNAAAYYKPTRMFCPSIGVQATQRKGPILGLHEHWGVMIEFIVMWPARKDSGRMKSKEKKGRKKGTMVGHKRQSSD